MLRERRASVSRTVTSKHSSIGKELRDVRKLIWELLNVVQLLQCYLRAAELEMRAAEESLKANLDAAGLEAQVLERIDPGGARAGAGGAAGGAGTRNGGARG